MPDHTIGETEGVSMNSKGHLFVYSRTGKGGMARGGTAAELFEFDQNYKFVKQWVPDQYGASFAHSVRVDKYDNVWFVDEGSWMIVKMDQNGVVKMKLGRKPEAIDYLERFIERGEKDTERYPVGGVGTFGRPTDVAWDAQDNIYISDGYTNSRFVKLAKDGTWVKAIGTHGNGPDQFSTPHGIAVGRAAGVCRRSRQQPHSGLRRRLDDVQNELHGRRRAVDRPGDAEVRLQRRRHGQDLPARQEHGQAAWLDPDRNGPGPDRLHHPRAPRRVRQPV